MGECVLVVQYNVFGEEIHRGEVPIVEGKVKIVPYAEANRYMIVAAFAGDFAVEIVRDD